MILRLRSKRNLEETLAQAISDLEDGLTPLQVIDRYPEHEAQLAPLLQVVYEIRTARWPTLSMHARVRGRERMHAALEQEKARRALLVPLLWRQVGAGLVLALLAGSTYLAWPGGPLRRTTVTGVTPTAMVIIVGTPTPAQIIAPATTASFTATATVTPTLQLPMADPQQSILATPLATEPVDRVLLPSIQDQLPDPQLTATPSAPDSRDTSGVHWSAPVRSPATRTVVWRSGSRAAAAQEAAGAAIPPETALTATDAPSPAQVAPPPTGAPVGAPTVESLPTLPVATPPLVSTPGPGHWVPPGQLRPPRTSSVLPALTRRPRAAATTAPPVTVAPPSAATPSSVTPPPPVEPAAVITPPEPVQPPPVEPVPPVPPEPVQPPAPNLPDLPDVPRPRLRDRLP